jgi:hypothetical protein
MKAERRHELQTNKLAIWVADLFKDMRAYWGYIVAGIVGITAICVALGVMNNRSHQAHAESWRSFFDVAFNAVTEQNTEPLEVVATENKGTPSAAWATQMVGDIELRRGMRILYQNRTSAIDALEQAREKYKQVLDIKGINPMLSHRANFGLGQASEALSDIEDAQEAYAKIVAVASETALGAAAQKRLDRLKSPEAGEFYEWFAKAELSRDPHAGMNMPNSNLPLDLGELGNRPSIDLPEFPLDGNNSTDVPFGPTPNDLGPNGIDPLSPSPLDPLSPSPLDPAPSPLNPAPTPNEPAPTPEEPAPTPNDPAPTPNEPAPTPNDPAPTPNEPAPTPNEPAPTPNEPAPTPNEPAPTPEEPAPTPNDPAPTPEEPAPTPEEPAEGDSTESDS